MQGEWTVIGEWVVGMEEKWMDRSMEGRMDGWTEDGRMKDEKGRED